MQFPYSASATKPTLAFPNRTALLRPILPITLISGDRSTAVWSLVDSGADFSLFPTSTAAALGIDLDKAIPARFSGSVESPQIAYFVTVHATIWNGNEYETPFPFELYAGFCETLEHVGHGVLGQDGFFSQFSVTFDLRHALFTVSR